MIERIAEGSPWRALLLCSALAACGGEGGEDSAVAPAVGLCDDAVLMTWDNFGEGFLIENCQPCHASTASERYGAPEDVYFDTLEDAWLWADRIVATTLDDQSMPPAGGVSGDDLTRLEWWLICGEQGL